MPFTFAHPAAVLPLRKCCPRFLNLPALVIGSLTPDLGYYLHNWIWSICGHSFSGSLTFDVPSGLLLLALFYLTIRPVARLLPYPHREACSAICPVLILPGLRAVLIAAFSVLVGAWTHIVWDGFTHGNGWCVRQLSASTAPLFTIGGCRVTIWHILQHCSTILGLVVLTIAYRRYAYGKRFLKHRGLLGSAMRSWIWAAIVTLPAVNALVGNAEIFHRGFSLSRLDAFTFHATVSYVYVFLPLVCVTGIMVSLLEYVVMSRREKAMAFAESMPESRHLQLPSTAVLRQAVSPMIAAQQIGRMPPVPEGTFSK